MGLIRVDELELMDTKTYPESVMEELGASAEYESFKPTDHVKRWHFFLADFNLLKGLTNKLRFIREHMFPSAGYMARKYQTDKKFLLPYLYIHRLLGGLGKYF